MRFLICGLGSAGRRHLRNLVALGQKDIVLFVKSILNTKLLRIKRKMQVLLLMVQSIEQRKEEEHEDLVI